MDRKFAPLSASSLNNRFLHELIRFNFRQLPVGPDRVGQSWTIDVHQIRISATGDERGEPTPEGMHHDGDDYIAMHLIGRHNAAGGVSTVCDNNGTPLMSRSLQQPMDTLMVWDPYVMHGVNPISPEIPGQQATRDVLLIGYHYRPNSKRPEDPGRNSRMVRVSSGPIV